MLRIVINHRSLPWLYTQDSLYSQYVINWPFNKRTAIQWLVLLRDSSHWWAAIAALLMHAKAYCEPPKHWDTGCKVQPGDEGCLAWGVSEISSSFRLRTVTCTRDTDPRRGHMAPPEVHQKSLHHIAALSAPRKTCPI